MVIKKQGILFLTIVVYFSSTFINILYANEGITILPKDTRAILALRDLPPKSLSAYVVNLDSNEVILSWNSSDPKIPLQS